MVRRLYLQEANACSADKSSAWCASDRAGGGATARPFSELSGRELGVLKVFGFLVFAKIPLHEAPDFLARLILD
jgi:hypothetical protein